MFNAWNYLKAKNNTTITKGSTGMLPEIFAVGTGLTSLLQKDELADQKLDQIKNKIQFNLD